MMSIRSGMRAAVAISSRHYCSGAKLVDVAVNDKSGVATVTMQRLPVNSLNLDMLSALSNTLSDLEKNKARGMILTSASNKVFSAGLDIMEMYKPDMARLKEFWSTLQEVWMKLYGSSYPTAAAINGHAPAGGCLLAMSCEYRVMVDSFTIGLNETQLGIIAPAWFINTMKNTISTRETELALTSGRLFKMDEALKIGLVDEAASDKADAIAKCEVFFKRFARISPVARAVTKAALRGKDIKAFEKTREQDLQTCLSFVPAPEVQKGLAMYLEALKKASAKS